MDKKNEKRKPVIGHQPKGRNSNFRSRGRQLVSEQLGAHSFRLNIFEI